MNDKRPANDALSKTTRQERIDSAEHTRQTWRSLRTLGGWIALVSTLGAVCYDLIARVLHIGPR